MSPSDILRNRYQIIKQLGSGNFGITYLAEDLDLPNHPLCVVKSLRQSQNPEELKDFIAFFDKEAKALSCLGDECAQIPMLFAHFQEGDEFYIVQEYVDGHDLSKEIFPGNKLSESQVTQLLIDILEVLAFVHDNNIIHRDVKAQNLMRRHSDGKIVLIDFGTVKEINKLKANPQQPNYASVIVGTPGYMPREQLIGYPKLCSDVYAVGMLGIYALTGIKPRNLQRDSETFEVIWQDLVSVNSQLANVLDKMVRSNSQERYQTAGEALQALQIPSSESTISSIPLAARLPSLSLPSSFPALSQRFFISFGIVFSLVCGMGLLLPFFSEKLKANAQICLAMMDVIPLKIQTKSEDNKGNKLYTLYGEIKNNQLNGCGTWIPKNNNSYQGIFTDNKLNGMGQFMSEVLEFKGEFKENKRHGEGKITFENGDYYIGLFRNNKYDGEGEFVYKKKGCKYKGGFQAGKFHGQGTCISPNGIPIRGTWEQGKLKGTNQTCCDSKS